MFIIHVHLTLLINADSLEVYTSMELLEHPNQYRCDTCDALVDAHKGVKLRRLPPILTVGLNRFRYQVKDS